MLGRLIGFWAAEIFSSRMDGFDVGPDHFLIPANGRDKVPSRREFVAQKIPHLAFDILRDPYRTLPFHASNDLRHRIFGGIDFILPKSSFLRYFGVNTTWYLHSQVA